MKRKHHSKAVVFGDEPSDRELAPKGTYDPPVFFTQEEARKICTEARKEFAEMRRRMRGATIDSKTRMAVFARLIRFYANERMPRDEERYNWSMVMKEDVKIRHPQRSFNFRSGIKVPRIIKSKEPV